MRIISRRKRKKQLLVRTVAAEGKEK